MVGEQGAILWLRENKPDLLDNYQTQLEVQQQFDGLIVELRNELSQLYQNSSSIENLRTQKQQTFENFKQRYLQVVANRWQGKNWFQRWFEKPINNARLVAISTYRHLVPEFEKLLTDCGGDFSRFYQTVKTVKKAQAGKAKKTVPIKCI